MEIDTQLLDSRTRQRNVSTWLTMDFGGVMAPLAGIEAELNALALPSIEPYMAIQGDAWEIKETQRDRTIELSQAEIDQDRAIAENKATTGRLKIAIERTADEYTLAAKIYDVTVRGLLMSARELAGLVEQEALAAEAAKAAIDVEKEGVRQMKVAVQIQVETIEAAQVAADIAKAQVDVAKAHVRAVMAQIEAGKAAVEAVEARVQVAMAEADKATLQADVAMIFAEIVTKQLTEVKLGAERAEIQAGYSVINSRLSDAVVLYNAKALVEDIKAAAENAIAGQIAAYQAARETAETLRVAEAALAVALAKYEAAASSGELSAEASARATLVAARNAVADARANQSMQRDSAQTAAQIVINAAHVGAYRKSTHDAMNLTHETEYISGG